MYETISIFIVHKNIKYDISCREFFRRVVCKHREDGLACSDDLKKCLNQELSDFVNKDNADYYANLERETRQLDSGFTYAQTCNHGNILESVEDNLDAETDVRIDVVDVKVTRAGGQGQETDAASEVDDKDHEERRRSPL